MLEPQAGRILLDGHDIRSLTLDSLRAALAVVFQDAGLFNRTIAENIAIGQPGADAAAIEAAARSAEAHAFIVQKPGGYDFMIGERGAALSGGERQRLAIARAMLKTVADADQILVLDRGRIVERGTFRQLVAQEGLFAHLIREGGFSEPEARET